MTEVVRTVEDARAIVGEIDARLTDAMSRATANQVERRRLAYDANTGDEGARKWLDKLSVTARATSFEVEDCQSALDEAKRRLAESERYEERARLVDNAEAARKLADLLTTRGQRIDEALTTARTEMEALKGDIDELHRLGVSYPRAEQFNVLGGLALMTHVTTLPLKVDRSALAPRERQSFGELGATWRAQVLRWAATVLGEREAA
jgi:hypothetical protein